MTSVRDIAARFCRLGVASHSESIVDADEIGDYDTFAFQDYRLEIKATMAGRAKPAKSTTNWQPMKTTTAGGASKLRHSSNAKKD
ncbi:hypothetical protein FD17_GL000779 [Lentilactobacillus sunkii DSM 19904]|uniref:Uncharacterized protein n=1 Tax=Lentilactobacillus sunkii DSM 19904 TaxID=1423808 RepID=A0A0R1KVH4_9LACO|nr:hypothetical protein FD17_GL000779 [Lentilactobacillus sunkii DSM 19904]